jgi:osmotically-inducible protein OsmY
MAIASVVVSTTRHDDCFNLAAETSEPSKSEICLKNERIESPTMVGIPSPAADRDLEQRVINYLSGRHIPSLRRLAVDVNNGTVTLRGRVQSFYEKQLSQACCKRVAGVIHFVDRVDVSN